MFKSSSKTQGFLTEEAVFKSPRVDIFQARRTKATMAQMKITGDLPVTFASPMSSQAPFDPFRERWNKEKACVSQGLET